MASFKNGLLATVAGLTLAFGAVTNVRAQEPAEKKKPDDLATVTQLYQTKESKTLSAFEAHVNKSRPSGTPRVVYVDPDIMGTWLQLRGNVQAYPGMIAEYLQSKKADPLPPGTLGAVAATSFTMRTGSAPPQLAQPGLSGEALQNASCVIIPYNPNLPAEAYMRGAFQLANPVTDAEADALEGKKLMISIDRQQMMQIVNGREAWGCFDTKYVTALNGAEDFERIMALHRMEVFKDVGGLMQAVKDGADPALIAEYADFRATLSALTASPRAAIFQPGDVPFYGSVIYETSPALLLLSDTIERMGVGKFRSLSGDAMKTMAEEIVAQAALTTDEATHMMGFAMLGPDYFRTLQVAKADPAVIKAAQEFIVETVTRQSEAGERSVREMTPEESARQLVPLITPDMTYTFLQNQIFGNPDVQKDPDDPVARFKVRRELIDKTRDLMDKHPEAEGVIRQVLQGIFNSNPLMDRAPPPKPAGPQPKLYLAKA